MTLCTGIMLYSCVLDVNLAKWKNVKVSGSAGKCVRTAHAVVKKYANEKWSGNTIVFYGDGNKTLLLLNKSISISIMCVCMYVNMY